MAVAGSGLNEVSSWPSSARPTRYSQMSYMARETLVVRSSAMPSSSRYLALRVMPQEVELATITPGSSAAPASLAISLVANRRAALKSPLEISGSPQQFWRGKVTRTRLRSSTRTSAAPTSGSYSWVAQPWK
jgi:hypothetical protein